MAQVHLGRAVRASRERAELSVGDLGKRARLQPRSLSQIEAGTVNTAWGNIRRIATAIPIPLPDLLSLVEQYERAEAFGKAVQQLRSDRGLTRAELAEAAGLSVRSVSSIERGSRPPTSREEAQLRKGLGRIRRATMDAAIVAASPRPTRGPGTTGQ